MISDFVLASALRMEKAPEGAYVQAWDINGQPATIGILKSREA